MPRGWIRRSPSITRRKRTRAARGGAEVARLIAQSQCVGGWTLMTRPTQQHSTASHETVTLVGEALGRLVGKFVSVALSVRLARSSADRTRAGSLAFPLPSHRSRLCREGRG